jgi:hypothetical protein
LLSFAYVYFLESGLFNELQPIQIKKSAPSPVPSKRIAFPLSRSQAPATLRQRDPADRKRYSTGADSRQGNVASCGGGCLSLADLK